MQKKNQNNFNQLSSVDSTFSISEHTTEQFEKCFPLQIKHEQDGNVPSRRHILGSKIFKEQLL